jgi:NADPH-dependent ferric siderophore reductase
MDANTTEKNILTQKLYRPAPPCLVLVKNILDVSPNLRRITFTGEDISNFPSFCPGAHIKVFFPLPHQTSPLLPTQSSKGNDWKNNSEKPDVRTYSVRSIRTNLQEIDIEFVLHGDKSPASRFAQQAKVGDVLGLSRPSGPDPMVPDVDVFFMVGDMTALPAIAAMLEVMPPHTKGQVNLNLLTKSDCIRLIKPEGIQVTYYINDSVSLIRDSLQQGAALTNEPNPCHYWMAGEEKLILPIRQFLLKEMKVKKANMYAIPYWREDLKEEDYHQTRHDIMDQN